MHLYGTSDTAVYCVERCGWISADGDWEGADCTATHQALCQKGLYATTQHTLLRVAVAVATRRTRYLSRDVLEW